jgi:hypothetical protein
MDKKRNLLLTILVVVAVFVVNLLTANIFNGITNTYVVTFLVEVKCAALAVLGAVILKKLWIYRRFDTALLKKGWTAGLFDVIFPLISVLQYCVLQRQSIIITARPVEILIFVLAMFFVGIYEETLFRGLLQNGFHEFFGEDTVGHVILAVVCAGLCFGAFHLTNALKPGVSLSSAAIQALNACGAGIFYGALYFRTGKCLWYNMLIHGFHDTVTFILSGGLNGANSSSVITQSAQGGAVLSVIVSTALYTAVGLFLLRKKKVEPLLKKTETEAEEEA